MVARWQLLALGYSASAIDRRIANGRLHRVYRGVYAVGRPELPRYGWWMAAVLSCSEDAVLSHESAAALWGIRRERPGDVEVSVPACSNPRRRGIVVHRRVKVGRTRHRGIPVTTPVQTLVDIAPRLGSGQVEAAVNEADKLDLIDPERLRSALDARGGEVGVASLKRLLDRRTFRLTDSELERRFLSIVRKAGLPQPETGRQVNGFKVDFYWPDLGLVVEADGLRYHRTPAQQARGLLRDQAHAAAGLIPLRFSHAQVAFESDYVESRVLETARRLER